MAHPITHLSAMTRSRDTWPLHRKKKQARNRDRKTIARAAQRARDAEQDRKP